MKALVYQGRQNVVLSDLPVPEIEAGEILLAVDACGLCGSDLLKIDSDIKNLPVPLGHELAGRVHAVGAGVKKFKKGDRIVVSHHVPCLDCHYCRRGNESMCREFKRTNLDPGGFAEFVRLSARHVEYVTFKFPAKLPPSHAAMTEPLACVLRNIRRIGVKEGDTVAVIGLGFIGLLSALALRRIGIVVVGVDLDHMRVRFAQKLGFEHAYTGQDGSIPRLLTSITQSRGADAVVITAGPSSLVGQRFEWVRDGGVINVFAGYAKQPGGMLDLDALYHREISVISSYSPQLEDLKEAHRILVNGELDMSPFTRDNFGLDEYDEAIRRVRGREAVKAIFLPGKGSSKK